MTEFFNLIEPDFLTGFLRERIKQAAEDRTSNQFILNRWFPNEGTETIDVEWDAGPTRDFETAIPFRTWTSRSDVGRRTGMVKKSGQIPPFSRMYAMTERDIIKLREAARQGGIAAEFAGEVFLRDVEKLVKGMMARMEIAIADSLNLGQISMGGENGVQIDVDWGRSSSHEPTVSTGWAASPTTADPFGDEEAILDVLEEDADLSSTDLVAVMNEVTYRSWKNTTAVKEASESFRVNRIGDGTAQAIRDEHGLPPVVVYKAKARTVNGTSRKLVPDGRVLYLPATAAVGATKWATPAIAGDDGIELEANLAPGPVAYMTKELEPYGTFLHGQGIAFPIFADTESTAVLDVEP